MPCALPPVDQSVAQLGWGDGYFLGPSGGGVRPVFHSGLDFMADTGSPVVVPWAGTVIGKGYVRYGSLVTARFADHPGHWVAIAHGAVDPTARYPRPVYTRYSHLNGESPLAIGQSVSQGDLIGYVGVSGLAPEHRDRPRLFMQAFDRESSATADQSALAEDPLEVFFAPLGVTREGGETPGRPLTPYEVVPPWGGRLVLNDGCGSLAALDPNIQRPRYLRYGSTQLSSTARYLPAAYAPAPSGGGGGLLLGALLVGGAWWLMRRRR